MKLTLNGKETELQAGTVLELLKSQQIEPNLVAVELNEQMIERENFDKTPLREGDRVELHYFMGGGAGHP